MISYPEMNLKITESGLRNSKSFANESLAADNKGSRLRQGQDRSLNDSSFYWWTSLIILTGVSMVTRLYDIHRPNVLA